MQAKTYTEKLRNPNWQRRRLEILQRDNFTCQLCLDTETELHVHHCYYTPGCEVWEYEDSALICYCKHCHAVVEHLKKESLDPIIIAKKSVCEDFISIYGIYKDFDGSKGLFIGVYYPSGEFEVKAIVSPGGSTDIANLIQLSEKL
jgi:hypothetical protein